MTFDDDTLNEALWMHLDKPGLAPRGSLGEAIDAIEKQVRDICCVAVFEKGADGERWAREQIRALIPWVDERSLKLMWGRFSYDCTR